MARAAGAADREPAVAQAAGAADREPAVAQAAGAAIGTGDGAATAARGGSGGATASTYDQAVLADAPVGTGR